MKMGILAISYGESPFYAAKSGEETAMNEKPLYWDASYEIVLALMDAFPHFDVDSVGTQELYQMILALPNFADDPALVNEGILNDILREWYEESTS